MGTRHSVPTIPCTTAIAHLRGGGGGGGLADLNLDRVGFTPDAAFALAEARIAGE